MLLVVVGAVGIVALVATSPWPLDVTLRHWAAAPNCTAARAVGLAPAHRGAPGYYSRHDADGDGIACENIGVGGGSTPGRDYRVRIVPTG